MKNVVNREWWTPWARIYAAARQGFGVRLTSDEVAQLANDGALMLRGSRDFEVATGSRRPEEADEE